MNCKLDSLSWISPPSPFFENPSSFFFSSEFFFSCKNVKFVCVFVCFDSIFDIYYFLPTTTQPNSMTLTPISSILLMGLDASYILISNFESTIITTVSISMVIIPKHPCIPEIIGRIVGKKWRGRGVVMVKMLHQPWSNL